MIYLLDTNTCVVYLNQPDSRVRERIHDHRREHIAICSVVKAELFYGAMKSRWPEKTLAKQQGFLAMFVSLPFDDRAAQQFGQIRATLERQGKPIGPYDLQIAATALANDLIVITHNTGEFGRVPGLKHEDWEI
jgi:tRNA(fMet)-specific endonuclease VapC